MVHNKQPFPTHYKMFFLRLQRGVDFFQKILFEQMRTYADLENIVDISDFIFAETKCVIVFTMEYRKYL